MRRITCNLGGGNKFLHMRKLRTRGLRTVVRRFHQRRIIMRGLRLVARLFGRQSGVIKTVQTVGAHPQRHRIFGQRLLGMAEFQKHVTKHFARWNVHLALSYFVLQIRGGAHLRQRFRFFPFGERAPGQHFAVFYLGERGIRHVSVCAFAYFVHQRFKFRQRFARQLRLMQMTGPDCARPIGQRLLLGHGAGDRLQRGYRFPVAHFKAVVAVVARVWRPLPSTPCFT